MSYHDITNDVMTLFIKLELIYPDSDIELIITSMHHVICVWLVLGYCQGFSPFQFDQSATEV